MRPDFGYTFTAGIGPKSLDFDTERAMEVPREVCKYLVYSFLCVAADALDTVLSALSSNIKPTTSLLSSDVDGLSDEEIVRLTAKAPRLRPNCSVFQLTPHTVAKASQDLDEDPVDATEANTLDLVFAKTSIPVPRVRRIVKGMQIHYIVMDYVRGQTLAEVWSTYSIWKKIYVAFTLRRYIRQLRRLKASPSTPPGPLSMQGPQRCESPIFGVVQSDRGPFASYAEMSTFFAERCKMAFDAKKLPEDHPWRKERFDDSSPLVLTHQDLNPRNIIVGEDGLLWMIDWAWAGYYPPWFEYVTMLYQGRQEALVGSHYDHWNSFIPFICGPYFKQERWLARMSLALNFA